ncbi:amidohydrolase family protein [Oceanibacterium hippocampi]|uniref:8-oxoguanine deaminase n=1 Tax=Oceanibacterium hippocampi TaxID=745714 RepID=A0A1Y5TJI8_9PROT|nr:amidohydrolase family protein [Oceanibacterium hippocampi]SLN65768.1 8-oxoguanine deaminase [Oceanibacterium hippocampi]
MTSDTVGLRAKWVLARTTGKPELVPDGTVVVENGRIADVLRPGDDAGGLEIVELDSHILLPGFVNAHTHCLSTPLFRGIFEDRAGRQDNGEVIAKVMMPLGEIISEIGDDDMVEAITSLGMLEAIKAGSTTIVDMPRSDHDAFGVAAGKMGLRAYIHPYLISGSDGTWTLEQSDGQDAIAEAGMATFHRWRERFDEGPDGRVRIGLGPHASDTVTPALMRAIARARDEYDAPVTIHLAQSAREGELSRQRLGLSPTAYLEAVGLLKQELVAAHCLFAADDELTLMADRGVTIAHCPLSYARSGKLASRARFTGSGVNTVVACDAHALDILTDLRLAAINSKYDSGDPGVGTAWELVECATHGAAEALGRSDLGRIQSGATADLVAVRLDRAHIQPVYDPIKSLVWYCTGRDVDMVMVGGETLVRDGTFIRTQETRVIDAAADALGKVWDLARERAII